MATPSKVTLQRWLAGKERGPGAGTLHRFDTIVPVRVRSTAGVPDLNCNPLAGSAYPMVIIGNNTPCSA